MGIALTRGLLKKYQYTLLASLFAIFLVSVAYLYAEKKQGVLLDAAVVVADKSRTPHETKDTDGDGMYDWEEEMRGTNPLAPDAVTHSSSTDTLSPADVPNTITSRFSLNLMGDYLSRSSQGSLSEEDKRALVETALKDAAQNAKDILYARGDIRITLADDPTHIHTYGNTIGAIMTAEEVPEDNELFILQRALQTDSPETLNALDPLIAAYKNMIDRLRTTEVPAPLVNEHLTLLNALLAVHNDIVAMRNIFDDGLPGAVRVQRYEHDVNMLYTALVQMQLGLTHNGALFEEHEAGTFFSPFTE